MAKKGKLKKICKCGCGQETKVGQKGKRNRFIHGHQRKFNSPFKKGNPGWNKGKKVLKLRGKNNGMFGIKRPDLVKLNKSRIGIPIKEETIKKQIKTKIEYWDSEKGKRHKKKLSKINKEWSKNNPDKVRERGIKGHLSCPRVSKQEITVKKLLEEMNIRFIFQYKYKLGIADFLIIPKKILFIDGNYWHGNKDKFPELTEKQIKQKEKDNIQEEYLIEKGYKVIRLWEHEIRPMRIKEFERRLK